MGRCLTSPSKAAHKNLICKVQRWLDVGGLLSHRIHVSQYPLWRVEAPPCRMPGAQERRATTEGWSLSWPERLYKDAGGDSDVCGKERTQQLTACVWGAITAQLAGLLPRWKLCLDWLVVAELINTTLKPEATTQTDELHWWFSSGSPRALG